MFDIGWSELLLIGVVALIVIGPKDLPKALATAGKWMARARAMAREFQSNVDDMIRQSELDDLRKQVQQARSFNIQDELEKSINSPAESAKPLAVEDYATPAGAVTAAAANPVDSPAVTLPPPAPEAVTAPIVETSAPTPTPTDPTKG